MFMSSVQKSFTIPSDLWNEFTKFRDVHPEFSYSGWIQKNIKDLLKRNEYIKCKYFKDGYCVTDSSVSECSKMLYGICLLEMESE